MKKGNIILASAIYLYVFRVRIRIILPDPDPPLYDDTNPVSKKITQIMEILYRPKT